MTWTLIEPCCGAASLATHLCGVYKRTLLPYQGSKWKLRKPLQELLVSRGYMGPPSRVVLSDLGPWGSAWQGLLDPGERESALTLLREWRGEDPQEVYNRLHNHKVSLEFARYTAEFLYLQRLAFCGKAVSDNGGVWKSPGFNGTSAYGVAATDKFGAIRPMIPSLISTLEACKWDRATRWEALRLPAEHLLLHVDPSAVIYFDPPYQGTTLYPGGDLSRAEVVRLAQKWDAEGAFVVISEAEPVFELGWETRCLVGDPTTEALLRGNSPEWITYNKAKAPPEEWDLATFLHLE